MIRKRIFFLPLASCLLPILGMASQALGVLDFGAKGDGQAMDTTAIRFGPLSPGDFENVLFNNLVLHDCEGGGIKIDPCEGRPSTDPNHTPLIWIHGHPEAIVNIFLEQCAMASGATVSWSASVSTPTVSRMNFPSIAKALGSDPARSPSHFVRTLVISLGHSTPGPTPAEQPICLRAPPPVKGNPRLDGSIQGSAGHPLIHRNAVFIL